jgi:hypothetical protein
MLLQTKDAVAALLVESCGTKNSDFELFDEPIIPEHVNTLPTRQEAQIPEVDTRRNEEGHQTRYTTVRTRSPN